MDLIKWDDKFATGIPGVDTEHQELIASINAFYSNLSQHADKDELINILNDIYGTIHAHFMLEERLMQQYGYDEYEAHRTDHAKLLDDIRDMTIDLEATATFDEQQLQKKLNDWFVIHFKTHDSRLHKLEQLMTTREQTHAGLFAGINRLKSKFTGKRKK